jgi:dGTPase
MLQDTAPQFMDANLAPVMVRDFIAGMTDDYFLKEAAAYGCAIPEKI